MNYEIFQKVIIIAEKMVAIECAKQEIKDFFINRNLNVTDSQVEDFINKVKQVI